MLNLDYLEKALGLVSPPSFAFDFSKENISSDCNWTQTHKHLVRKRTLDHLAKFHVVFY